MIESTSTEWTSTKTLDVRGLRCPLPVLRARKALFGLQRGERLLVEATDPMAAIDFPHYCDESGQHLVATETKGAVFRFLIEKT